MSENRFWITVWCVLAMGIAGVGLVAGWNGYLDDIHDQAMAKQGLQKYVVVKCIDTGTREEWHEAGWVSTNRADGLVP